MAWGTGWKFPDELSHCKYMGTAQDGYGYVWHYFMQEITVADWVYNYDYRETLIGDPSITDYSVTISCGEPDSAVSGLTLNKVCTNATTTIDDLPKWAESITAAVVNSNTTIRKACT